MKSIYECFSQSYKNNKICAKLHHYLEIYDILFKDIRDKQINFLEIGIKLGGSISFWNEYFSSIKNFTGIDIDSECKKFETDNTKILIGDQADINFLESVKRKIEDIDIILDDGGHQFHQQINSFKILFEKLKDNGIYIIEDTHSSYDNYSDIYPKDKVYNGGKNKEGTAVEFFKNLSDEVSAWSYIKEHGTCPLYQSNYESWSDFLIKNNLSYQDIDYFRENIFSITFFDSMIVIKKKTKRMPYIVFNDSIGDKFFFFDKKQ